MALVSRLSPFLMISLFIAVFGCSPKTAVLLKLASSPTTTTNTPLRPSLLANGFYHSCVLFNNGSLKCFGYNTSGVLGQGDVISRGDDPGEMGSFLPTIDLGTGLQAVFISGGGDFSCAILSDSSTKKKPRDFVVPAF